MPIGLEHKQHVNLLFCEHFAVGVTVTKRFDFSRLLYNRHSVCFVKCLS